MKYDTNGDKIIITNALPYANGPLHVGHLVGYVQADIWKRYCILIGKECIHICGADCHGVPIMLSARKNQTEPKELTRKIYKQHILDLEKFGITFSSYLPTNRPFHRKFVQQYYKDLFKKGFIYTKVIKRPYDPVEKMFVADRMILGSCPYCKAEKQYGDSCDKCSKHYNPRDMINPISVISNTPVEFRNSLDIFFKFSSIKASLIKHMNYLRDSEKTMILNWINDELKDWSIARDMPYYGIQVPGYPNKCFYVWFDAFLSYLSILEEIMPNKDTWDKFSTYMFMGKDIMHLHAVHFVSMLLANNKKVPHHMQVNGFINIGSKKMSKSKTFFSVKSYLETDHPCALRWFIASHSNNTSQDISFDLKTVRKDFNKTIVSKLLNISSRLDPLLVNHKHKLSDSYQHIDITSIKKRLEKSKHIVNKHYECYDFSGIVQEIDNLSTLANKMINDYKPWSTDCAKEVSQEICSVSLNIMATSIGHVKPILPKLALWGEQYFNVKCMWNNRANIILGNRLEKFTRLYDIQQGK